MELDEWKGIWEKTIASMPLYNEQEVLVMLDRKSNSIIQRLRRSVWFELITLIVAGGGIFLLAMNLERGAIQNLMYSIVALHSLYIIYFLLKIKLFKDYDQSNLPLRDNLSSLHRRLSQYVRFYFRSYTLIYLIYAITGLIVILMTLGWDGVIQLVTKISGVLLLLGYIAISAFMYVFCIKWHVQHSYQRHLDRLNALLQEFDERELVNEGLNQFG
jgi:hypothetical protein